VPPEATAIGGVVETSFAEHPDQPVPFDLATEVCHAVAGEHPVEQLQMLRNLPGKVHVARGRQHERTPLGPLPGEVVDERNSPGKRCDIQAGSARHLTLKSGLPAHQPQRQQEQIEGLLPQQGQDRFHQQIRPDQGTVQVHHQRQLQWNLLPVRMCGALRGLLE